MNYRVVSLAVVSVLTFCCFVTAVLYRARANESRRLQIQVNRLRLHNLELMAESSRLRARMEMDRTARVPVSYVILHDRPVMPARGK